MALIDPKKAFDNGVPKLEDLNIFAELKIYRRRYNEPNKRYNDRTDINFTDELISSVNFLGFDEETKMFTTNYTENKENFGISSINLKLDSSYVPQIDMTFIDVRGQSFYRVGGSSPYAALQDLPPPIFELTLKGFYGQKVNYRLHLVKQSGKFDSSGNYITSASLIGLTYAPLADLFLTYVKAAPYLYGVNMNDGNVNTTLELIAACNTITDRINKVISRDKDENNELSNKKIQVIDKFLGAGKTIGYYLGVNMNLYPTYDFSILTETTPLIRINAKSGPEFGTENSSLGNGLSREKLVKMYEEKIKQFNKFKDDIALFDGLNGNILNLNDFEKQFPNVEIFITYFRDASVSMKPLFILKNLDKFNREIQRYVNDLDKKIGNKTQEIINKAGDEAIKTFGADLNIGNIFSIILHDVDLFCQKIKEISNNVLNDPERKKEISGDKNNEPLAYPFPTYSKEISIEGITKRVKSLPPDNTVESQFIDELITAIIKSGLIETQLNSNKVFENTDSGNSSWFGLNAFDSDFFLTESPYVGKNVRNIYRELIIRAQTFIEYSGGYKLDDEDIKLFSEAEAYNLINSLNLSNKLVIDEITNDLNTGRGTYTSVFNGNVNVSGTNNPNYNKIEIYSADSSIFNKKGIPVLLDKDKLSTSSKPLDKKILPIYEELNGNWLDKTIKFINNDETDAGMCQYNIPYYFYESENNTLFSTRTIHEKLKDYNEDLDNLILSESLSLVEMNETFNENISGVYKLSIWDCACFYLRNYRLNLNNRTISNLVYDKFKPYYQEVLNYYNNSLKGRSATLNEEEITKRWDENIYDKIVYVFIGDVDAFNLNRPSGINSAKVTTFINSVLTTLQTEALSTLKQETVKQDLIIGKTLNDIDLKTEVYYNIKSFHDRWILGGYDIFNKDVNGDGIISKFKFIDRGYNDISDKMIIDLLPIAEMELNGQTSIYTLILQILTKNNMEFFALPSYIPYMQSGNWTDPKTVYDMFGTVQNDTPVAMAPQFICMYVGGTSSVIDNGFNDSYKRDDGATLEGPNATPDLVNVNAFKVTYGEGDQSLFTNIAVDQEEFKQTLESINILDRIAKSQDEQVVKTQNLFNVYEQRSYSCEVEMMGCVMIQPTMYFTIDIPLWKGVYLILEVSHSITPNTMMTKFRGVRVPDKTKPFLTSYATYAGISFSEGTNNYSGTLTSSIGSGAFIKRTPWSAAFISFITQKAGAKFPKSMSHTDYAQKIRNNSLKYDFQALNPATNEVKIGDILIENRENNNMTFTTQNWVGSSHGDIVVDISDNKAYLIGGNKSDSVKKVSFEMENKKAPSNKYFVLLRPKTDSLRNTLAEEATKEFIKWRNNGWTELSVLAKPTLSDYYASTGTIIPIDKVSQGLTPSPDGLEGEMLLANETFRRKLREVTDYLGCSFDDMVKVMRKESGLKPQARNKITGNAVGLIQFTKTAIEGWGVTLDDIQAMSGIQQLAYVQKYFEPKRGKLKTYEDIYFYTFFPAAIGKPDNYVLETKKTSARKISADNPSVALAAGKRPGDPLTVGDFKKYLKT